MLSTEKASCDRVALPNLQCMLGVLSVSIIHQTLICTTGIFNVHTDANAHDRTWGCMDTIRESALGPDSGEENLLPHQGTEPVSAACWSDTPPAELHHHSRSPSCHAFLLTSELSVSVVLPLSLPAAVLVKAFSIRESKQREINGGTKGQSALWRECSLSLAVQHS